MEMNFDVIAERTFVQKGAATPTVRVIFGRPVPSDNDTYSCRYNIEVLGELAQRESRGVDSLQALLLAVKVSTAELETLRDREFEGDLKWEFATDPGEIGLPNY